MVVVEKAVDAFVIAQRIESLVHIRYGIQYDVILSIQLRIIRTVLLSQCQKGEVVHKSLEHITGVPRFSRLPDVGDFLWGDAALEIAVADFISTRTIGKGDGKVPLAVVSETCFTTFFYGTQALPISICIPVIRSNSRLYLAIRFSSNTFSSIPTFSGL